MEFGGAFADPSDELGKPRMGAQCLNRRITARQLCLGQGRMNLGMANLVQEHRGSALAATQLRHEVVQALARMGRNRPVAVRADRVGIGQGIRSLV